MATTTRTLEDTSARFALPVLVFGATIGLSAYLLFSVQPIVGRLVLPVFGGTPAVWATSLFFFQAVLVLGYLYGHLSVRRLGPRRGSVVHLGLVGLAFLALLVAPRRLGDLRVEGIPEVLNLLAILAVTIGVPTFVLTATTPLVSAWHAAYARRRRLGRIGDPYWLYALSNTGSLAALLAYPFLVEPEIGLTAQIGLWTFGFGLLAVLFVAAARATGAGRRNGVAAAAADAAEASRIGTWRRVAWSERARWLLLAAIPSGLLSAVTTYIATDLVSAPLLWIVPLSIYLLTFIVAFSPRIGGLARYAVLLAPAAVTLLWVPYGSAGGWPILPLVLVEYGCLGIVALALHGRLADLRPEPVHLTEYYLIISIGGVLASAFVAILAPIAFPGVWEYPILLVGALVALAVAGRAVPASIIPSVLGPKLPGQSRTARAGLRGFGGLDFSPFFAGFGPRFLPYLAVAVAISVLLVSSGSIAAMAGIRWLLVGGLVLLVGARPWFLAGSTALVLALAVFVLQPAAVYRDRSFFGVTEVLRPPGSGTTILMNGTTVHGVQLTDPELRGRPTAYYAPSGPFGDIFAVLRSTSEAPVLGIVGLGAGALSTYLEPGDSLSYYEIDPIVVEVASDPTLFTFLADAPTPPAIVLGDARLTLASVPAATFDILFLDAFSSDAIPTHLMTAEAFGEYARVLRPDGVLVVHISNRYYDLTEAVAAAAGRQGLPVVERRYAPSAAEAEAGAWPSHVLVASTSEERRALFADRGWTVVTTSAEPLTDDFSDVLRFLRWSGG